MKRPLVLDIGGEGRHAQAWNVNPSPVKTFGPEVGCPIPRRIHGRADAVPLPDQCADLIIMERTPLSQRAVEEIRRISRPGTVVILRHFRAFGRDPHELAKRKLPGRWSERVRNSGAAHLQETVIELDA